MVSISMAFCRLLPGLAILTSKRVVASINLSFQKLLSPRTASVSAMMPTKLDAKILSLAVAQALEMWIHVGYEPFLQKAQPGQLTDKWFRCFLGQWKVARTIRRGRRESVRRYLDVEFRQAVFQRGWSNAVDEAATHIQNQKWSASEGRPLSLVSKVGFFLRPSNLVPKDKYALKGLNTMRCENGRPKLNNPPYCDYLKAFDEQYATVERQLADALKKRRAVAFARKLGCPAAALKTRALRRKVFDNYLMGVGGYPANW